MENENWYVYILLCRDGTLYTGITNDIKKRMLAHEKGKGAKYTKGRGPFKLVYENTFNNQSMAMKEENRIKKLSKVQKLKLVQI
ncbi:MAG: endonuclease [Chloroflexi bacterium]|jgi:putative endonuclease|nr:endonuclease [Chloroflexota bacterium]|tara:strand:- start:13 stop:264 length:252 start_codon:yes stop_codon:yes gene_type:complete